MMRLRRLKAHAAAAMLGAATISVPGAVSPLVPLRGRQVMGRLVGTAYAPLSARRDEMAAPAEVARIFSGVAPVPEGLSTATALLLAGRPESSIVQLQSITNWQTNYPAMVLLSVAHLERARRDGRATAAAAAANAAERATRLARGMPEGWFNRAAAFEQLGWARWTRAWDAYRDRDQASAWLGEVGEGAGEPNYEDEWQAFQRRLLDDDWTAASRDLSTFAKRHADRLRALIENQLLQQWAESALQADEVSASGHLERALAVAEVVFQVTHDSTAHDWVVELGRVDPDRRSQVARAIQSAFIARRALENGEVTVARSAFAGASRGLVGLPAHEGSLDLVGGSLDYYDSKFAAGYRRLSRLAELAARPDRAYVRGRSHFAMGAIAVRTGRFSTAESHYEQAKEALTDAGEVSLLAAAQAIHGSLRFEQGDQETAWTLLRESLRLLPLVSGDSHRYSVLTWGLRLSLNDHLPFLAMSFSDALESVATTWGNNVVMASVLSDQALQLADLGDDRGAHEKLNRARERLALVTDRNIRPVSNAQFSKAEAGVLAASDPCGAQVAYDRAIELSATPVPYQLARLYLASAEAKRRCGTPREAADAYLRGIEAFELQRQTIRSAGLRVSHFDELWGLYSGMAFLTAVEMSNPEAGLMVSDAGRVEASFPGIARGDRPLESLKRLQSRLDDGTCVLSYLVSADRVLIWAVTRRAVRFATAAVSELELRSLVTDWRFRVERLGADRPAASRLFDLLVRPVADELKGRRLVVVVPDADLHDLAFGALWDGQAYMVERAALWQAQSLRSFSVALAAHARSGPESSTAFVIGDPAFDALRNSGFSRLPGAASEAASVAAFYRRPTVLLGIEATRAAIADGFRSSAIVHVAAHAVADLIEPSRSYLLAADGPLEVDDLPGADSVTTRVAVLAACRSASGAVVHGYGPLGLAQSLLARGVPTVLGMLWDVSDADSYALAVELHRRLSAGEPVAQALHGAQLHLLRHGSPTSRQPRTWAAVVGLGQPNTSVAG